MVNDRISDMIIRLKNAARAGKQTAAVPYSKLTFEIAKILEQEGFLSSVTKKGKKMTRYIVCELAYNEEGAPKITEALRVSKSSKRIYQKVKDLLPVRHGKGIAVVSTSQGVMTEQAARKLGVGGEVLFNMW